MRSSAARVISATRDTFLKQRILWRRTHSGFQSEVDGNDSIKAVFSPTNTERLSTVQDMYRFAVSQFNRNRLEFGHSTVDAYEDASFLILHELSLPNNSGIQNWFAANLTETEKKSVLSLIEKRCVERIPSPYLVNGCYLQGEYFFVDERVLIPRSFIAEALRVWCKGLSNDSSRSPAPSTEFVELDYEDYFGQIVGQQPTRNLDLPPGPGPKSQLVRNDKECPFDVRKVHRVLDLCTGSGCLAILAAKFFPNIQHVDAVDLFSDAVDVANINIVSHDLEDIVYAHEGDLFQPVSGQKYDLIIANPPYVSTEDMENLSPECSVEPTQALEGGPDGLDIVVEILRDSKKHLNPQGGLLCEIGRNAPALFRRFGEPFAFGGAEKNTDDAVRWISTECSQYEVFYVSRRLLEKLFPEVPH